MGDLHIKGATAFKGLDGPRDAPLTLEDGTVIGVATLHPDGTVTGSVTEPKTAAQVVGTYLGSATLGIPVVE